MQASIYTPPDKFIVEALEVTHKDHLYHKEPVRVVDLRTLRINGNCACRCPKITGGGACGLLEAPAHRHGSRRQRHVAHAYIAGLSQIALWQIQLASPPRVSQVPRATQLLLVREDRAVQMSLLSFLDTFTRTQGHKKLEKKRRPPMVVPKLRLTEITNEASPAAPATRLAIWLRWCARGLRWVVPSRTYRPSSRGGGGTCVWRSKFG